MGFVKPTESTKGTTTIIKQNNTIIQLLVKISEGVEDCKEIVQNIRKVVAEQASAGTKSDITGTIEDLQKKFK